MPRFRWFTMIDHDDVLARRFADFAEKLSSIPAHVWQSGVAAEALAEKAIGSVASATDGMDGITYLADAIQSGIETPLTSRYREEILKLAGAGSLEEALSVVKENLGVSGQIQQRK